MAAGYLRFLVFTLFLAAVFIVPKGPREDQLGFVKKNFLKFLFFAIIPEVSSTLWALMGILPTEVNLLNVIFGLYP